MASHSDQPSDLFTRSAASVDVSRTSSTVSAVLLRQRAKAEAAKTRLIYGQREADMLMRQASLQADWMLLASKRDVDEAEAELRVMNEEVENGRFGQSSVCGGQERTQQFVRDMNAFDHTPVPPGDTVAHTGQSQYDMYQHTPVLPRDTVAHTGQPQYDVYQPTPLLPRDTVAHTGQPQYDVYQHTPVPPRDTVAHTGQPQYDMYQPTPVRPRDTVAHTGQPQYNMYQHTPVPPRDTVAHTGQPQYDMYQHTPVPPSDTAANTGQKQFVHNYALPATPYRTPQNETVAHTRQNIDGPSFNGHAREYMTPTTLSANANTFTPNMHMYNPGQVEMCSELTRFVVKKDLLLSRLTKFDDKSEFFATWKMSFKSVVSELNVSPTEEMDLLVKWLGPDSSKHALSIRASNIGNPTRGLDRIWERLHDRYASPENVEASLKAKLDAFPKLAYKDYRRLFELSDIVQEIEAVKQDEQFGTLLGYYDSSSGVIPIVNKLPSNLQEKWTGAATKYKQRNRVAHPPFSFFADFLRDLAKTKNDPSFIYDSSAHINSNRPTSVQTKSKTGPVVSARKTEISKSSSKDPDLCPLHKTNHSLNKCRTFRSKSLYERKEFILANGLCFRCCGPVKHLASSCTENIHCEVCKSNNHSSAMHIERRLHRPQAHGEEKRVNAPTPEASDGKKDETEDHVSNSCTQICGTPLGTSKSCAKTVLVRVYPEHHPEQALQMYAIVDDQSNRSLAKSDFFDHFDERGNEIEYALSSCAGYTSTSGRRASGYMVESLDSSACLPLPTLIECNQIPNIRHEIPSPEAATHHAHLRDIADQIPDIDPNANISLLIGRDLTAAHHVLDQRTGPDNSPFAHKLRLGWVIIGEVCLGNVHPPSDVVTANKTHTLSDGRTTLLKPCPNGFELEATDNESIDPVFRRTRHDDTPGLSIEDRKFLEIMDREFYKDSHGNWVAPLPFRTPRPRLPDNRSQAIRRARALDTSLKRDSTKKEHMVQFMKQIIQKEHCEVAPTRQEGEESWYLPLFGVYHPKKRDQIRGVFDSSAKHDGLSLNSVLMSGPDLTNNLLGVLLRFRKEPVAVSADVQQMFHCFKVQESHRNFLRFFWYKDNDPEKDLIEYRMTVHVFGNSPSPAVASYGLRKSVSNSGADIREFVERNFYVDDGLVSCPSESEAISLMKGTQQALSEGGNLRLHKIASNSKEVLRAFQADDLAKDIKDLDLGVDVVPLQRSLGMSWDIETDSFTYRVSSEHKAYTRRGVLSTVNSLFDPIGFVAPVTIQGKLFLRDMMSTTTDWDEPLPPEHRVKWEAWRDSLPKLENVHVPRGYVNIPTTEAQRKEIHVFADASKEAIGAVSYLKIFDVNGRNHIGFVLGKAKVAPIHGHTIPRLELCAAVMAVELAETVLDQLDMSPDSVHFYTDSKVVLGYIHNETRRFFVYVGNRVDRIRRSSRPDQWTYVSTELNPADHATRPVPADQIQSSPWLQGPSFLHEDGSSVREEFGVVDADLDREVRPQVDCLKTTAVCSQGLGTHRFEKFSSWKRLAETLAHLKHVIRCLAEQKGLRAGRHQCPDHKTVESYRAAESFIVKEVQRECYHNEIDCLMEGRQLPPSSAILPLSPILDENGVLRVGGRLNKVNDRFDTAETNPIIIPKHHHIAILLVRHFHESVQHQGRHFTEGAVRAGGYWIIGGKRLIQSLIHKCVTCRKLRGKPAWQKMADLPEDRLEPSPPFTNVGVDTFGPWSITTRRTRGGQANSKRWAVLFTCLVSRAVHIEVVEELSSSSFINALRRFVALRGNVTQFRSDRGTNFIGATDHLKIDAICVENGPVRNFLYDNGTTWTFNPPHASHMGGVWERMIGISRRILDSMLLNSPAKNLTHEVLTTFMAEVCAIINARPITSVSTDPEEPLILTPATLLTQRTKLVKEPFDNLDIKDMYTSQWKRVQLLADEFWRRWRKEYLHGLQSRRKWKSDRPNLKEGDIVLLKDSQSARNDWPVGIVDRVFESEDGRVRNVEIRVSRDGKSATYVRPISETVPLVSTD